MPAIAATLARFHSIPPQQVGRQRHASPGRTERHTVVWRAAAVLCCDRAAHAPRAHQTPAGPAWLQGMEKRGRTPFGRIREWLDIAEAFVFDDAEASPACKGGRVLVFVARTLRIPTLA